MTEEQKRIAERITGLYYPVEDITPEQFFQALARLRKEAADEIERLIDFLDRCGPDPDLERNDGGNGQGVPDECEGPEDDLEPSLGSVAFRDTSNQERWADGRKDDLEDEHDGREPENEGGESVHEDDEEDGDREPTLGWTTDGCIVHGADDTEPDGLSVADRDKARRRYKTRDGGDPMQDVRQFLRGQRGRTVGFEPYYVDGVKVVGVVR